MDDRERARQRYEQRTASAWYKLAEGENTFRVLPTPKSAKTPGSFYEYKLHRDVGPRKQAVRCGKDMDDHGKCWMCDVHIPSLRKKGQEARASALVARDIFMVQIAKVADDGKMTGPLLYQPAKTIADQILSMFWSKKKVYHDANKGYNLTINRTGTGKNDTRYGMIEADEESSKVPQAIMEKLKPFSALTEIPVYSEAKQKAAISGRDLLPEDEEEEEEEEQLADETEESEEEVESEVESEEEEEEPAPKKKAPAKKAVAEKKAAPAKKKAAPVVEEEEDEEEVDDEDEEEIEPDEEEEVEPDEEEEEIDLDEEEEEEPAPPPKKKAAPAKKAVKKK